MNSRGLCFFDVEVVSRFLLVLRIIIHGQLILQATFPVETELIGKNCSMQFCRVRYIAAS